MCPRRHTHRRHCSVLPGRVAGHSGHVCWALVALPAVFGRAWTNFALLPLLPGGLEGPHAGHLPKTTTLGLGGRLSPKKDKTDLQGGAYRRGAWPRRGLLTFMSRHYVPAQCRYSRLRRSRAYKSRARPL